ncbi:helix-turn-helix domain-containing protein [Catenulispora sp. NL8]|uniref:Helix-turn-helix domain-containing protein n=1 Tax=Catenulispora pinistramenti TaxID=2705254 RepID=A0ABS5L7L1_9ACTN|nr:helix-turn-helix domain-containing protein [Catenulispora pinistramenti]
MWNSIRERLCSARSASRLSQEAFASRLGVSARSLRDWEKGYDLPALGRLIAWARLLGFRLIVVASEGVLGDPGENVVEGESYEKSELRRLVAPLRIRRRQRSLSQTDMGLLLGVDRVTLASWERASHSPTVENLLAYVGRVRCRLDLEPIEP